MTELSVVWLFAVIGLGAAAFGAAGVLATRRGGGRQETREVSCEESRRLRARVQKFLDGIGGQR